MDDDTSSDVVAINSDGEEVSVLNDSDKPIMQLFKRLINNDNKQNTVLTNAQIVDILNKEFNINLWDIHELEGEIYLTIMKKYLKDWPQWDEFDTIINKLKLKNDKEELERMLHKNYVGLKEFLKDMLQQAQVLAKTMVDKLLEDKANSSKDKDPNSKSDDVILEIHASRNQLNQLFFRRPHPDLNGTIFNGVYTEPTQIKVTTLPIEAILNWWDIKITISKGSSLFYEHRTIHQLSHVLVNKTLPSRYNPLKVLPQELQLHGISKTEKRPTVPMSEYLSIIDNLSEENPALEPIYDFIILDLHLLPEEIFARTSYRRFTSKYPYIRHLYKEVENPDINSRKYDLRLEETLSPMYKVYIGQVNQSCNATLDIECCPCMRKFTGTNIVEELKAHFAEQHTYEPDWKCTNCNNVFTMSALAQKWWTHKC